MAAFLWRFKKFHSGKGRTLTRIVKLFVVGLDGGKPAAAGTGIAAAQTSTDDGGATSSLRHTAELNPVAQVRETKSWEYGPFVNWRNGVGDRARLQVFLGAASSWPSR